MISGTTQSGSRPAVDTILVVDPEILARMLISEYLRQCGYRVVEAVNADEAMIVLNAPDVGIDVVLSNVEMQGSNDGFALAKWVREKRKDVKVILVGSPTHAADAAGELCDDGPALVRPYEPQAIVDRIKRLLGDRASRKKVT